MKERIKAQWDRQHIRPSGVLGHWIGERMARQHRIETDWTLGLIAPRRHDTILELGFGAGRALARAARLAPGCTLTGVDLSRAMLVHASLWHRRLARHGRMRLVRGSIDDLPFRSRQFSAIYSIHTYYFWRDPADVLRQLADVLRPGGRLAITLASGTIDTGGAVNHAAFGSIHADLLDHVHTTLPALGFAEARLARGPNNRRFNNVALMAWKP